MGIEVGGPTVVRGPKSGCWATISPSAGRRLRRRRWTRLWSRWGRDVSALTQTADLGRRCGPRTSMPRMTSD